MGIEVGKKKSGMNYEIPSAPAYSAGDSNKPAPKDETALPSISQEMGITAQSRKDSIERQVQNNPSVSFSINSHPVAYLQDSNILKPGKTEKTSLASLSEIRELPSSQMNTLDEFKTAAGGSAKDLAKKQKPLTF